MTGNPETFRRMADCVELLAELDGVEVVDHGIRQRPVTGFAGLAAALGGDQLNTKEQIVLVLEPVDQASQERPDYPDAPDPAELREAAEEVGSPENS